MLERPEEALQSARLITNGYHTAEWEEWARARGFKLAKQQKSLILDSQEQGLEAAERGLGIAMGRRPLVDERIKAGSLISPFGQEGPMRDYRAPDIVASPT